MAWPGLAWLGQLLSSPIQSPTKRPGELVTWDLREAPVPALTQICPGHAHGAEDSTSASPWLSSQSPSPTWTSECCLPLPQGSPPACRHVQTSWFGCSSRARQEALRSLSPWLTRCHPAGRGESQDSNPALAGSALSLPLHLPTGDQPTSHAQTLPESWASLALGTRAKLKFLGLSDP